MIDVKEVNVPQDRKRLLIVGHKGEKYPHLSWELLPNPTKKPTIRSILKNTLNGAVEMPEL